MLNRILATLVVVAMWTLLIGVGPSVVAKGMASVYKWQEQRNVLVKALDASK